jgi:hypothetical protein
MPHHFYGLDRGPYEALMKHGPLFLVFILDGLEQPVILPGREIKRDLEQSTTDSHGQWKLDLFAEGQDVDLPIHGHISGDRHIAVTRYVGAWELIDQALRGDGGAHQGVSGE